jgi:hypothetical protein
VGAFYAKISKPVLSDLAFDFGEVTTAMQYPDVLPDLYKGSQLVLVGRYRGPGKVRARLTGMLNGKRHAIPFSATFPEVEKENAFVARLWAQRRIDFLLAQNRMHGERDEARTEVIALSTRYNILTPYTSMVAARPSPQQLASITPSRVKPGDPVVRVRAPKTARSVTLRMQFGQSQVRKTARWDPLEKLWTARFLVPPNTVDGTYPIEVEVEHGDGRQERLALSITIDTAAPAIAANATSVRAGQTMKLSARAVLGVAESVRVLLSREDGYTGLKSLIDIRRVTAHLWDGREIELRLDPDGVGFVAVAETNSTLTAGRYPVVFTATDYAGNTARAIRDVEVSP